MNGSPRALPRTDGSIVLDTVDCDNCGSSRSTLVTEGRDHEYPHTAGGDFRMVRCDACGLLYLNPRPAVSELDRIYPEDYYAYQIVEQRLRQGRGKGSLLRRFMDARATERLKQYTQLVTARGRESYRILDIGCGDGTVLNQWKAAFGTDVETHGVEMNEKAAAIAEAQGHVVMPKRIEECDLEPASYDLIFSFHVVEHVTNPTTFMRAIAKALKPDGYLIIETPNVDTADFRWFEKRDWGAYHFPRHFNLYDAKTFRALAKKADLDVMRVEYLPSAVFWIWTMHSMMWARWPKLADRLFPPVDILLRGSPWNWLIMSVFTFVDLVNAKVLGKTACMRILMKRAATG